MGKILEIHCLKAGFKAAITVFKFGKITFDPQVVRNVGALIVDRYYNF